MDPANCGTCKKACAAGLFCSSGACGYVCSGGTTACADLCTNILTDRNNCGVCGKSCHPGEVCSAGGCALMCGPGLGTCPGPDGPLCVDHSNDGRNCARCGAGCPSGHVCASGTCVLSCQQGLTACAIGDGGRQCVDTATDRNHCGGCAPVCSPGKVCSEGQCEASCALPTGLCRPDGGTADGGPIDAGAPYCANLASDNLNCGACGAACAPGTVCVAERCGVVCGGEQTLCVGDGGEAYCATLGTDNGNCGSCGTGCDAGMVCSNRACGVTCGAGLSRCEPMATAPYCANLDSDDRNCGACENACPSPKRCIASTCTSGGPGCLSTQTVCPTDAGSYCAGLLSDNANCGTCGHVCGLGTYCAAGVCLSTGSGGGDGGSVGCAPYQTLCPLGSGTFCASLQSDNLNCGTCDNACAGGTYCVAGVCGGVTCGTGQSLCQRPTGGSFCAALEFDPANCGTCNNLCPPATPYCVASACNAQNYGPGGVQVNVALANLPSTWSQCFVDRYNAATTSVVTIQAQCNKANLLMACRQLNGTTLKVAAWAPRADVFYATGTLNLPHIANGVGWYFDPGNSVSRSSWGFAPSGAPIARNVCDTRDSSRDSTGGDGDKRLCWETNNWSLSPGWRCGVADDLHFPQGAGWERVMYHAD